MAHVSFDPIHLIDDHAKNFSFLMGRNGDWRLSPAYDLTFSWGLVASKAPRSWVKEKIQEKRTLSGWA